MDLISNWEIISDPDPGSDLTCGSWPNAMVTELWSLVVNPHLPGWGYFDAILSMLLFGL